MKCEKCVNFPLLSVFMIIWTMALSIPIRNDLFTTYLVCFLTESTTQITNIVNGWIDTSKYRYVPHEHQMRNTWSSRLLSWSLTIILILFYKFLAIDCMGMTDFEALWYEECNLKAAYVFLWETRKKILFMELFTLILWGKK